jgi:hypothetical protein
MRLGMGVPKTLAERRESRVPMEVRVQITGHPALPGTEETFTENVSAGGARVWSTRRWKPGDRLTISTLTGSFKSIARVAYCQLIPESGFAVGLEFLESREGWVIGGISAA